MGSAIVASSSYTCVCGNAKDMCISHLDVCCEQISGPLPTSTTQQEN